MAELKRWGVDIPLQGMQRFYVVAKTAKEAVEKALARDTEDEQSINEVEFDDAQPSIDRPALVKHITRSDEESDGDWEDDYEDSTKPILSLTKEGVVVNGKLANHYARYTQAFVVPSEHKAAAMNETASLTQESTTSVMHEAIKTAASDLGNASVRAGAAEFADMVREPVTDTLLKEFGIFGKGAAKMVGVFISTPIGEGAFNYTLGVALPLMSPIIPHETGKMVVKALGEELRIAGQAAMLRPLIRALRAPLTEFLQSKLGGGKTLIRVDAGGHGHKHEEHEEEREAAASGKKSKR